MRHVRPLSALLLVLVLLVAMPGLALAQEATEQATERQRANAENCGEFQPLCEAIQDLSDELGPVTGEVKPVLDELGEAGLNDLIDALVEGLEQLRDALEGVTGELEPACEALDPILSELIPVVDQLQGVLDVATGELAEALGPLGPLLDEANLLIDVILDVCDGEEVTEETEGPTEESTEETFAEDTDEADLGAEPTLPSTGGGAGALIGVGLLGTAALLGSRARRRDDEDLEI